MKRASLYSLLMLLLAFGATGAVFAEESQESLEERCRTFAKEDGVPAAEMADYLKECVESSKKRVPRRKKRRTTDNTLLRCGLFH